MAYIYVSTAIGNNDSNNGTTWTLAKATIAGALAIAASGDIILMDSAHAESATGAAISLDVPTAGYNVALISVNRNGSTTTGYSARLAGASATVNTSGQAFNIGTSRFGILDIFGLTANAATGSSSTNSINLSSVGGTVINMTSCTLNLNGTSSSIGIQFGVNNSSGRNLGIVRMYDCTVGAGNVAGSVLWTQNCNVFISNLSLTFQTTKPVNLVRCNGNQFTTFEIVDSDLSAFNFSSSNYVNVALFAGGQVVLRNCKLDATPSIVSTTWATGARDVSVLVLNCDSADTKTKLGYYTPLGTLLSTESVYRTSTPAAQIGTTPVGWQVTTSSLCCEAEPFILLPMSNGFDTHTTSMTATIHVVHDSATNLHDRNLWAEYEYVSDASYPRGTLANNRNASPFDGTAVDWASDSDTWTGTGGFSNPNKQKVAKTFTPAEGSAVSARLFVGLASKTLYVDPQFVIT